MAGTKAGARKAAKTRKANAGKKGKARKSPAKRKSSAKKSAAKRAGKLVSSPSFGGRKFRCEGRKVRAGKKTTRVARVFCKRDAK